MLETLQKMEYESLTKDLEIGVYDYIPNEDEKFFCVIGDCNANSFYSKTFDGYEITSSIYIYALERSMIEVKKQIKEIIKSLSKVEKKANDFYFEFFEVSAISVVRIDLDLVQGKVDIRYRVEEEK